MVRAAQAEGEGGLNIYWVGFEPAGNPDRRESVKAEGTNAEDAIVNAAGPARNREGMRAMTFEPFGHPDAVPVFFTYRSGVWVPDA